jgi:wyosine [tRNA(Phe)-imidazoG37] synthetase (radical SAM superfamily)
MRKVELYNKNFYNIENGKIKNTVFYILANITTQCNRNCSYCGLHDNKNIK